MNPRKVTAALVLLVITALFAAVAYAQNTPINPETLAVVQSEQANATLYPSQSVFAEAGNITELNITGVSATKSWQGYYGNVSGTIILEDAQGNRFYDWTAAEPQGEVFASVNSSITWGDIACAPIDNSSYKDKWYDFYGINETDYDNINVTYNYTDHPEFYVGYTTLNSCRTTYTFVSDSRQFADFPGVILSSDSNGTMIFTAMIEDKDDGIRTGLTGFDGADHDFQVLVAENGIQGGSTLTQYYFWIELD